MNMHQMDRSEANQFLMDESKLTIVQKHHIQRSVNKGESLPPPVTSTPTSRTPVVDVVVRRMPPKRRSKQDILRSGAYDRDKFYPQFPRVNQEQEKEKFQSLMAYGKVVPPTPRAVAQGKLKLRPKRSAPQDRDVFDDLVIEVKERVDFLSEMRELGLEKKYRPTIVQEIAAKIRQMEALDKQRCQEQEELLGEYRSALNAPRPLPITDRQE